MHPFAPLGRIVASRGQKCGYSPDDTEVTDCPNDATWHILWTIDADAGLACDTHIGKARRFVFVDSHRIGPDCAMPGAAWDLDRGRCLYPDEPSARSGAVALPAPAALEPQEQSTRPPHA